MIWIIETELIYMYTITLLTLVEICYEIKKWLNKFESVWCRLCNIFRLNGHTFEFVEYKSLKLSKVVWRKPDQTRVCLLTQCMKQDRKMVLTAKPNFLSPFILWRRCSCQHIIWALKSDQVSRKYKINFFTNRLIVLYCCSMY